MKRRRPASARGLVLAFGWIWLAALVLVPFLIVLKISLSQAALALPPYTPAFNPAAGWSDFAAKVRQLSLDSYRGLLDDPLYLDAYLSSVRIAAIATALTLAVAYPMAFAMSRAPVRLRPTLVVLAVAPFWTSFLIRVYAWIAILKDEGLLNRFLMWTGFIHTPLHIFASDKAVMIGIVYSYLPFMILPLYNAIERQDPSLAEAAADLGASPFAIFWRVTFPLSLPGVVAGCLLVFIPAVGEFVIPDLLGGSHTLMIGQQLWNEFFENRDWPTASAVAVVLLVVLLVPMLLFERAQMRDPEKAR